MIECLILAAGRGSRMGAHADETPKCLIPFLGRPLLDWQIRALDAAGVGGLNLVCGYLKEKFLNQDLKLWENPDWQQTNMVATMFCARPLLETANELVVAYGDIIYEPRILSSLLEGRSSIAVTVDLNWRELWEVRSDNPLADAESLTMNARNEITDIGRKVSNIEDIQAQYMGLIYFDRKGLDRAIDFYDTAGSCDSWLEGRVKENCYMTDFLRGLVEAGQTVQAVPIQNGWLEFDTVEDLENYENLAESGHLADYIQIGGTK
tara:strand:- start:2779 stop:3570 length:792 start_codon:yes stop_codon:yes gene_type:complete